MIKPRKMTGPKIDRKMDLGPDVEVAEKPSKIKETFRYTVGKSTLGHILVARSEFGLVAILCDRDAKALPGRLQDRFRKTQIAPDHKGMKDTLKKVIDFIDHPQPKLDLPLDIRGTRFQMRVWNAVRKIAFGKTSTYSDIARDVHAVRAVRAVGTTCTNNLFFIAVPCHRVLSKADDVTKSLAKASPRQRMLCEREMKTAKLK